MHVLRYFSSFISVSHGKVIHVSEPSLAFCPLASHLYDRFKKTGGADKKAVMAAIKKAIESKIKDYGFFTPERDFSRQEFAIPCGASEMLMAALKKRSIEAAVIVCDGAGTVITDKAEVAQGIGARMNSLLMTSPIIETMARLKKLGCRVVFVNALIDQVKGVEKAIEAGYKKIAVTVNGHDANELRGIRRLESSRGVSITVLVVCTTGVSGAKVEEIRRHADIVWSCASGEVREKIGAAARLQISEQIPVFVLTKTGMDFVASCADDKAALSGLKAQKQYLIANRPGGAKIKLGAYKGFLQEAELPVLSRDSFVTAKS